MPPLSDLFALLGLSLVLSALVFRLLAGRFGRQRWAAGMALAVFVLSWLPLGTSQLPVVGYVRGITSDLSVTLVAIAFFSLMPRPWSWVDINGRDKLAVFSALSVAALLLYPLALGLGDWDPYRLGWGSPGMWLTLLLLSGVCWFAGLRLLPFLVALALFGWSLGLLESTNLWDYLLDPWLGLLSLGYVLRTTCARLLNRADVQKQEAAGPARSS